MQRNIVRGKSLSLRAGSSIRMLLNRALILSIAAICMLSVRAGGQGAADVLPSPISTGELVRYMQQLELSEQQQIAATAMHDEYKRSYQSLYENEIRDFLDLMRSMSGFNVPERDELEKMTRDLRKMESRIRSLDNNIRSKHCGLQYNNV